MSVVVRCPGCRGASQVDPGAVGQLVLCPRCHDPFLAAPEATPVAPPPAELETPPPRRTSSPRPRARHRAEPVAPPGGRPADPHDHAHSGGLPASVLIGLALLPFVIPLLWLIAPTAVGQPPALSLAAPLALAVAASALSLAVIYTIDWAPATRIKGVLMLVGLAYFAGLSLYFLKKDMLERVKRAFEPGPAWEEFRPPKSDCRVQMPGKPGPYQTQPLPGYRLTCHTASRKALGESTTYVIGFGPDPKPNANDDAWFAAVEQAVVEPKHGHVTNRKSIDDPGPPGREWEVGLNSGMARIVRVFRVKGRLYYLSAEGPNLDPNGDAARRFLDSFQLRDKD